AGDGGVALHVGPGAIVEGVSTWLDAKTPQPPAFSEALAATAAFPGLQAHPFPHCLGCGTARTDSVALRIFPGPLVARELVAAVWYPSIDATADGLVRPEFAWAALDCPGGWAAAAFGRIDRPAVLGRMAARLVGPIPGESAHIVVGWLDHVDGRKLTAGSALYSRDGVLEGFSRQTWITL